MSNALPSVNLNLNLLLISHWQISTIRLFEKILHCKVDKVSRLWLVANCKQADLVIFENYLQVLKLCCAATIFWLLSFSSSVTASSYLDSLGGEEFSWPAYIYLYFSSGVVIVFMSIFVFVFVFCLVFVWLIFVWGGDTALGGRGGRHSGFSLLGENTADLAATARIFHLFLTKTDSCGGDQCHSWLSAHYPAHRMDFFLAVCDQIYPHLKQKARYGLCFCIYQTNVCIYLSLHL